METEHILQLQDVTKKFGDFVAVDGINFELKPREIHAILGENGAGKTTLMNLIYGLEQPTSGHIFIAGEPTVLKSPKDAIERGIGMVHQHFMLIENLTVAENIALTVAQFSDALDTRHLSKFQYKKEEAVQVTAALSEQFGLDVDPNAPVRSLSVGVKQRVEILKALAVNARILILDEPTAVLSPQEVESFFAILRLLQADGRSILFISHKMGEVLDISDSITVLRRGKKVYSGKTGELSARQLAKEMLGEELADITRTEHKATSACVLHILGLRVEGNRDELAVSDLTLQTYRGEIVGIAGIDGNGQRELAESIMGLRPRVAGRIEILGESHTGTKHVRGCSVGYIPEDRRTSGVIPTFSVAENLMLNAAQIGNVTRWGIMDQAQKNEVAARLIAAYDIRPPVAGAVTSKLSGGNQQKVVLAREIAPQPELLIAVNPTRGLDMNAARYVHVNLLEQREQNKSVLLISTELDEVLQLSDRVFIMSRGKIMDATVHREDIETLGLLMMGEVDIGA